MSNIRGSFLNQLEAIFLQALESKNAGDMENAVGYYEQALDLSLRELSRVGDQAGSQQSVPARLRFLHIPKTAGTSFHDCLQRLYPGGEFQFTGDLTEDLERWRALSAEQRLDIRLISGHAPYITNEAEIDTVPAITLLRDPIARVRSYCQHVSEGKIASLLTRFPPDDFDLNELLQSDAGSELDNLQTRQLLGIGGLAEDPDDPAAVYHALEILADLTAFGLTERFEQSLMLFRRRLGWTMWPVYRRLNAAAPHQRLRFEPSHEALLRRRNAVDLQLYVMAASLFEQRLAAMVPDLAEQMEAFAKHQAIFTQICQERGY
ncbi:hypothetical protein [Methylogaea oryzae]|uniref:Sulfotransferase family protein n=1 Tax=Methylogaea oryzae TaxID=1295382 RepID=A0A8D5AHA5_9GAMM|nr:hypothetical protein [Methylogaea oryzae]BBL70076.1 hypothetical protein MoryE10_06820 [Methylogaea oryzae]